MNYLRNLLRKLWPFVTRRELLDVARTQAVIGCRTDYLEHRVSELEAEPVVLEDIITLSNANNLICNRLDKLEVEAAKLKTALDYITSNVYRRDEPKKKPSRKKPAKKRGGAKA